MNEDDPFIQAEDAIKELFRKIMPPAAKGYTRLYSGWRQIVGEEISFHVVPKDVVNGVLILETDHPGWAQRIKMMEESILESIGNQYSELNICKITIHVSGS